MDIKKRTFKFYMTDEFDNEFSFEETIDECDSEYQTELDYLLEQFKSFLKACGYQELSVSKLQYLEDEEWKYVLQQYGEWKDHYDKYIKTE